VPYSPVSDPIMRLIVKLKIDKISRRLKENCNVAFAYDDTLIEPIASRCTEVDSGAENQGFVASSGLA